LEPDCAPATVRIQDPAGVVRLVGVWVVCGVVAGVTGGDAGRNGVERRAGGPGEANQEGMSTVDSYDVVVIGSGHNALVSAAYLARSGRSVLVLERNDRPGGFVRTEELTLPGFRHDVYSAAHPLFLAGPVWADLGEDLTARGLTYLNTDRPTGVSFPDGRTAVMPRTMDAMVDEADRLAPGDGAAFVDLMDSFAPYAADVFGLFGQDLSDPAASATIGRLLRGDGPGLSPLAVSLFETARTTVSRFSSPVLRAMLAPWVMHLGRTPDDSGSGIWVVLATLDYDAELMLRVRDGDDDVRLIRCGAADQAAAEYPEGRSAVRIARRHLQKRDIRFVFHGGSVPTVARTRSPAPR